ncbi:nucleotide kinase domain-containing protein [Mucilaginibacter lacusdianchii]|uniref:nucleotide kinase domain-containing protein n=1 Tax=Mucilaginibacter lacusdianchii TaxID=2684211 RepID=UPI0018EEF06B|nr:nucleotide kinase domain-containing protein [Mucilaginibacter sp. JXJ CY 39]
MMIRVVKQLPKAIYVLDTYWKFAAERQEIFFNRIDGKNLLTADPILIKHKFTNAYRAADRVSQYLISQVIYRGDQTPNELLFRILLFKTFNKIETWELLRYELGEVTWRNYSFNQYSKILHQALGAGETIYSGAYMMASGASAFGYAKKHENHLKLLEQVMRAQLADRIAEAQSLEAVYQLLLSYPTIGKFLAYQYAIDINYSTLTNFDEMEFVMPGPGAKDGIRKCFSSLGDYNEADAIRYVTDLQEQEFDRLGIQFKSLWGRHLQLIDCQNLFCETDKYARVAHPEVGGISNRTRIKQLYTNNQQPIHYFFPPKWELNDKLSSS